MNDSGLVPYDDPYPAQLRRIRDFLDQGVPVYVEHNEFATCKKLVITPLNGMAGGFGNPSLGSKDYWHLSWINTGSMWVPLDTEPSTSYVAEKLNIRKWWLDAQSIAAFIHSLQTRTVVRAKEV